MLGPNVNYPLKEGIGKLPFCDRGLGSEFFKFDVYQNICFIYHVNNFCSFHKNYSKSVVLSIELFARNNG